MEVYVPGSADDVWVTFETSEPILGISKGDILNPGIWENTQSPMKVLKVVNLEHLIWDVKAENCVKHKLMIFTKEVEGTRKLRIDE
ncbi:MAG: hypothetical protein PHY72_02030 [Candidatus Pacebacteria bacterium]|nr:hypothetical protein [Candidatus Paceibacterota bacterium]